VAIKLKRRTRRKPSTALMLRRRAEQLAAKTDEPGVLGVFSRLARDRRLTVDKLVTLVGLQERIMARNAAAEFDAAYRVMQPLIPRIARNGKILNKQGEVQSRYSKYEDIRTIVDPILQAHGFSVHNRTEWPETAIAEVVGSLTHAGGHTRESRFRSASDASGGKNAIQGLGSAVQYGRRYTLIDLLNIVQEGVDDDGQAAGKRSRRRDEEEPRERRDVAAGSNPRASEPITNPQRRRLFAITQRAGRSEQEVREWLLKRYKLESTKDITIGVYEEICKAVEARGPLPSRAPGED
jgi:ERF superfamily